jgi:hypothetical protein
LNVVNRKGEIRMTKSKLFALELAAQLALALATGLAVSIVLAGATMLLAAA